MKNSKNHAFIKPFKLKINLLFYLPLLIAMSINTPYALMILALPVVSVACYIGALTRIEQYQQVKQLIRQFILTISLVYALASQHPASGDIARQVYVLIAYIALCVWLYRFVKDDLMYRRHHV